MLVRDWMTSNPLTLAPEESIRSTLRLLRQHCFQQFPVIKDGKLVGMITAKDIRDAPKRLKTVDEVMIYDPPTLAEDTTLEEAARIVCDRKINALPVISGKNELVGIITVVDILDDLIESLGFHEELIREKEALKETFELFQITCELLHRLDRRSRH